jgi:hypothetical protein
VSVVIAPSMSQLWYKVTFETGSWMLTWQAYQQNQHAIRRERRTNVIGGTKHGLTTWKRCQVSTGVVAKERQNSTIMLVPATRRGWTAPNPVTVFSSHLQHRNPYNVQNYVTYCPYNKQHNAPRWDITSKLFQQHGESTWTVCSNNFNSMANLLRQCGRGKKTCTRITFLTMLFSFF